MADYTITATATAFTAGAIAAGIRRQAKITATATTYAAAAQSAQLRPTRKITATVAVFGIGLPRRQSYTMRARQRRVQ